MPQLIIYLAAIAMSALSSAFGLLLFTALFAALAGAVLFKHEIAAASEKLGELLTGSFFRTDP
jgi:hypothetical protein